MVGTENSDALRDELAAARAEIERLRNELDDARRRTDIGQSIHEFRRLTWERFGLKSVEESTRALRMLSSKGLPDPKKRQAFAVSVIFALLPASLFLTVFLVILSFFDRTRLLMVGLLIYVGHIVLDDSAARGGKPVDWFKGHPYWKHVTNYFPIELRKMNPNTPFPSEAVYLFGYHPHGLLGAGCFLNFVTTATGFPSLFPGINLRGGTLSFNFRVPFFREVLLRLGSISVSASSIKHVLGQGPGSAVVIVPGGAAEALDARPGVHDLTLQRRNGFFRIALQHGVHLVPIYSFGENELYDQLANHPGSILRDMQNFFLRRFGYSAPYYLGAGGSGHGVPFNPVPRRHPIITIVGDPIPCNKVENPTQEQIEDLKERYIEKLKEIFDRFADQYAPSREGDLRIVK